MGASVANGVAGTYRTRRVTHRSDMSNIHARNLPPRPRVTNLLAGGILMPVLNDNRRTNGKTSIGDEIIRKIGQEVYERT